MIRSAALMATSVPDPTARPRSALARAGPSLTPSPTMATDRPPLAGADHGDLVGREGAGHDIGHPDGRPTARAVGSLSPVRRMQWSPSACSSRTAASRRRSDRVGDGHGSDDGVVSAHQHGRPAERFPFRACAGHSLAGMVSTGRSKRAALPDRDLVAVDRSPGAHPGQGAEPSTGRQGAELVFGGGGDGPGHEVLGRLFERSRPPQERAALDPGHDLHVGDRHLPFGDRPRLVEHHRVDLARGLERLVALEEDPEAGTRARGDEQGGGRGQAESARTGDDQDRERGAERPAREEPPASSQPPGCTTAMTSTAGTKTPEIRSASRWTAAFSFCASSTSRTMWASWVSRPTLVARTTKRPPTDDRAADHPVAGSDVDGQGLAGHGAAIDG